MLHPHPRLHPRVVLWAALLLGWSSVARAQMPDRFSWGEVQSHPYAVAGGIHEGLPDGDYLTPNEDQGERCEAGCVLYATIGTMEMQYKIQLRDPQMTLDLSEAAPLDSRDVQNKGLGSGALCTSNCAKGTGMKPSTCVPDLLKNEGVPREGGVAGNIIYKIGSYELFNPESQSFDQIRARILEGPIMATVQVDNTLAGQKYLSWMGPCPAGYTCPTPLYHAVVIVGYKQTPNATGAPTNRSVLIKNSWGKNLHGFSDYVWVGWENDCLYKDTPWLQIDSITASNTTLDSDGDGLPDHRDICPDVDSGRTSGSSIVQPNLDGDALGDACDPDMDGDGVLDLFDCHPANRYLAYDLDQDGVCDDPLRAVGVTGVPSTDPMTHPLYTPAFKDYKDPWTIGTVNTAHAEADGDTAPGADLPLDTVCSNQCARITALPGALRPSGFSLTGCQSLCSDSATSRDSCTPFSAANSQAGWANEWHACHTLADAVTDNGGEGFSDLSAVTQAAAICRRYWSNPADGQIDTDGDGVGDFCDAELSVRNLATKIETENYQLPGDLGIELKCVQCYKNEVEITFDAWGGRSLDGQTFGEGRDGTAISACTCPRADWDATCDTYCPTQGEYPSSGDPAYNPGAQNAAWDPISSPKDCLSKRDIVAGVDYHLCRDQWLHFMGQYYEHSPRRYYGWRWQPFYDPDREVDGAFAEHPSPASTDANPRLVKIRVSWPNEGETPAADEKAFLPRAETLKSGCFSLAADLLDSLQASPDRIVPPSALYVPQWIPPGDPVSDFARIARPGTALALFGEHVVALDPLSGAIVGAAPVSYKGAARLQAAQKGASLAALGAMDAKDLPASVAPTGASAGKTPIMLHLNGGKLWLGLPALSNTWLTWEEAYGAATLPSGTLQAVVASVAGQLMLIVRETDGSLAAHQLGGKAWSLVSRLPKTAIDPDVKGMTLALHASGQQLYFVGGDGPGWNAMVHRWDLRTARLEALDLPSLSAWDGQRSALGVALVGETLFLVGPKPARLNLLDGQVQLIDAATPDLSGAPPFVYVDGESQLLSMMPVGTGKPFTVSTMDLGAERPTWSTRPLLDAESRSADSQSGTLEGGAVGRLVFAVTEANQQREHRVRLEASSTAVALRILDASGTVVAEDLSTADEHKELGFTPASDQAFYVIEVSQIGSVEPGAIVSYTLEVRALEGEEGCSCSTDRGGPGLGLGLLLTLGAFLLRRRRPGRTAGSCWPGSGRTARRS